MKLFPIILENSCRVVTLFQLFFLYIIVLSICPEMDQIFFYEQGTLRPNMLLHIWVDFSLLFKNPREIKIFRHFSLSWRNILVDWFTISQLSKYTSNSMLWVLRYPATDTTFVKTLWTDVGPKHMTFFDMLNLLCL